MSNTIASYYPLIKNSDGSTATENFISDYLSRFVTYDAYARHNFGERVYYNEDMEDSTIYTSWLEEANDIVAIHLDSWARIYHALSLQWNPLYNVDGTETETHSTVTSTNTYGEDNATTTVGQTSVTNTIGSRTNGNTNYEVTYEDATEHESGRNSQTLGSGTDTSITDARTDTSKRDERTDTSTTSSFTITHERAGNIGVTKTTELLEDTWRFYQKDFFKMVIDTIINESGACYD